MTVRTAASLLVLVTAACGGGAPEANHPRAIATLTTPTPPPAKGEAAEKDGVWTVPDGPRDQAPSVEYRPVSLDAWKKAVKVKGIAPAPAQCASQTKRPRAPGTT